MPATGVEWFKGGGGLQKCHVKFSRGTEFLAMIQTLSCIFTLPRAYDSENLRFPIFAIHVAYASLNRPFIFTCMLLAPWIYQGYHAPKYLCLFAIVIIPSLPSDGQCIKFLHLQVEQCVPLRRVFNRIFVPLCRWWSSWK